MVIGLTGASGFIGTRLLELYDHQMEFVVASKSENKKQCLNAKWYYTDYSEDSYTNAFSGCDAVIHLGGLIQHNKAATIDAYLKNISSTQHLLTACEKNNIHNIVFSSSTAVYEKTRTEPYTELSEVNPLTPYGISKLCCEKLGYMYHDKYGMNIKMLRLAYVLGYNTVPEARNQLPMIYLQNALLGKPLPVYGEGRTSNTYVYVDDVCDGIIAAVMHPEVDGVFNIGYEQPTSNLELAKCFCDVFQMTGIEILPDRKESGLSWSISVSKARDVLDFEPKYDLVTAIASMKKAQEDKENEP